MTTPADRAIVAPRPTLAATAAALLTLLLLAVAPAGAQARPSGARPAAPAPAASAPAQAALRIAVVNSRKILLATPGYAKAESTFNRELAGYQAEVQKLEQGVDSAANDLEVKAVGLRPQELQQKRQQLEQLRDRADQRAQELRERAAKRERELLKPIQDRVTGVVDSLRTQGGYAIVFDLDAPGNTIVSVDDAINLTDRVVARLKGS